jgi:LuxR family maltose regulon positive regulatory protein
MAFREVAVTEIREVLRAWLAGAGLRQVAAQAGVDRKTARRYVQAAMDAGLARDGGLAQLSDELVGQVAQAVRPVRPGGHGQPWDQLEARHAEIGKQVRAGLSVAPGRQHPSLSSGDSSWVLPSGSVGPARPRAKVGVNSGSPVARWERQGGGVAAGVSEVVIATKLFRPDPRHQMVQRERLYDLLRQGNMLPLTLIVAPAGWGKSTLVADWLVHDRIAAGWVSLDGGDDDPKRFWRYLLLAADRARPRAGTAALRRLDMAGSDVLRDVLPAFVNEVASSRHSLVLVLDDYHLVSNRQVHDTVATLLDRCPPQLHLIIVTRADPPLPVSRLRVRGQMAEIRAEHLRFSLEEAREFFDDRLGTSLPERDVHRLLTRTEGWPAGLQLAALRLRDRADPSDFIERFTGADWHIASYLCEEVLDIQPPRIREFLLQTSVLNRMSAPLCDALTQRADGEDLIGEIHRTNLFLIPLDEQRRWFRYHHLFGGLLRHELTLAAPRQPAVLHKRAAEWYAAHGDAAEAIGHAIASGDFALSRSLIAAHWRQPFNAGHVETVRMWLDALPPDLVAADASLSAARVWTALDTGGLEEAGAALDAAEASGHPDAHLAVLRALHMYKSGDVGGAAGRLAEIPLAAPGADDPFVATVHRLVRGISSMWLGDFARAGEMLTEAARRAEADGNRLAYIYAQGCQALMAVGRGDLAFAEALVLEAESVIEKTLSDLHFVATFPRLAAARLAAGRGEWDRAQRAAAAAVELGRRGAGRVELAAALLTAASAGRTCPPPRPAGDHDRAAAPGTGSDPRAFLAEARGILRHCPDPGPVVAGWLADEQRAETAQTRQDGLIEPLTDRELTILRLLPAPTRQRELASALFVTPNTLRTHLRAIYRKLGAESRDDAVIRARERGLL